MENFELYGLDIMDLIETVNVEIVDECDVVEKI